MNVTGNLWSSANSGILGIIKLHHSKLLDIELKATSLVLARIVLNKLTQGTRCILSRFKMAGNRRPHFSKVAV